MPFLELMQTISALIRAENDLIRNYIIRERANLLLTDAADQLLANLLEQYKENRQYAQQLEECRLLLRSRRVDSLLAEISQLTHPQEMERCIVLCQKALSLVNRENQPEKWADLQLELGRSIAQNPLGNRALNLEQAIHHFQQALEIYTRQAFLQERAITMHNLALAYSNRIRGEKADNFEMAISYYRQMLTIYTPQAARYEWARTRNSLAKAYRIRIQGMKADNLEEAIKYATQALTVYTRQTTPYEWAKTMNNLAAAYSERIRGERADNLEEAIRYYKQALTVYTRQAAPYEWAGTINNLAAAYSDRIRGERADNLEEAIRYYKQVLIVRTRQALPEEWAQTMNNLAAAYLYRIRGARADNLEETIKYATQALEVFTRQAFPDEWASAIGNLANAYFYRIRGARAENLEETIKYATQVLEIFTPQAAPYERAQTMNNLVLAYCERIRGEKADNLEKAIKHAEQALTVYTFQAFPEEWAETMNNLTTVYLERIRGEKADNLEKAIKYATKALEVFTRQAFPEKWAQATTNLAAAYLERIRGERADNLEKAIRYYKQALTVYTRQAFPEKSAQIMNNLAAAYLERIRGERVDNLEKVIKYAKQVLDIFTRQAFPEKWALIQHNLATAYFQRLLDGLSYDLSSQKVGGPLSDQGSFLPNIEEVAGDLEQAIWGYRQALEVRTPSNFPQNSRDTAYLLGSLLLVMGRFTEARQAFQTAHQAVEALRGEVPREGGKKELAKENADLYARLVFCCLHEEDEKAAFEYAAAGKGRAFVDTLASGGFNMLTAIDSDPTLANDPLLQQYRSLSQEIDNIRLTLNSDRVSADDKKRLRPELEARQSEYDRLWEDLTFKYPNLTATVAAPSLTASEAMTLAANLQATLVEYVEHAGGWSAFVVTQDAIQHVPLKKVDDKLLNGVTKWIKNIENKKASFFRPRITRKQLTQLYSALIAPLQEHLPPAGSGERLVIAPFGTLHQLPINAAQNPDSNRYLSQDYTVTFTPSLAALRVSLDGARQANWSFQAPENPIHIAHAGHKEMANIKLLQKADQSAAEMAKIFPDVKQLSEKEATPAAVAEQVVNRDLIHIYSHGIFEPNKPDQSGLLLDNGFLTVQRIITDLDLKQTQLTTLAACQTGRVGVTQGEELVGLIQALLIAGSKSVVATLWKVDESPTQAFFQHFYRAIKAGHSPAAALTLATQAIRQTKGWEHPYYWAAFQISGFVYDVPKPMGLALDENA